MDETRLVLLVIFLIPTIVVPVETCVSFKMKRNIRYDPGSCEMVDLDLTVKGVDCVQRCNKTSMVRIQKIQNLTAKDFISGCLLHWRDHKYHIKIGS